MINQLETEFEQFQLNDGFYRRLENAAIRLIKKDRFFGNVMISLGRRIDRSIPTAAVGFEKGGLVPTLFINPDFFLALGDADLETDLLKHEMAHAILRHIDRRGDVEPRRWNIAADLVVNDFCPAIKKVAEERGFVTVDVLNKRMNLNMSEGQTIQYYLAHLPNDLSPLGGMGADEGDSDAGSHSKWEELSEEQKELLKEAVLRAAGRSSTEHIPSSIQAEIERMKNPLPLYWERILRNYVGQTLSPHKTKTRKKLSRRFGTLFMGRKKDYTTSIVICIDTSGSVDDSLITRFFVEIDKLQDINGGIIVVECDSDVRQTYPYTKGMPIKVSGRGGTRYDPAIKFAVNKYKPELIIMLGDGDSADNPDKPRCPVIWCNPAQNPSNFGRFIKLSAS